MTKEAIKSILLILIIFVSLGILIYKHNYSMLLIMQVIIGLLLFFSIVSKVLLIKKAQMAEEISARTMAWWWMVAVFMVAVATHRIVSFFFLGLLCFLALREYFSLVAIEEGLTGPLSLKDRLPIILSYSAIPVTAYLAYIKWYGLYIIIVPVYFFLLIPIIFVLQNRTQNVLRYLGYLSIGLMFFVFNLGHSLFMINLGAMALLFCFFLTEARDVLAFWVGRGLAAKEARAPEAALFKILNAKIAESINPKKTWGAGIISALLVAILAIAFVPIMPQFPKGRLSLSFAAIVGLAIGILGLMGDLVFSMIKRDIGVKDTGSALPGHGGIIDRLNSLIFTIPITFHLLSWRYG